MCRWFVDCYIFFFKQKTAYEMRISDWSSDVCSSDLYRYDDRMEIIPDRAGSVAIVDIGGRTTDCVVINDWRIEHSRSGTEMVGVLDVCDKLRSEEHTSELQSLMRNSYAVFCLKQKNKNK